MSDQSKLGLGKPITTPQSRDAIHIAVAPVIAAHTLIAGRHVGIDQYGHATEHTGSQIGIVDPFLKITIEKGDTFWLFLYPGTITSLRHEWEHPKLPIESRVIGGKSASEVWMRKWAMKHMGEDYYSSEERTKSEDEAYAFAINAGHELHIGPYESARDYIDNEWWNHWEIITGTFGQRSEYFSCAC